MNDRILMYKDKLLSDMDKEELIEIINRFHNMNEKLNERLFQYQIKAAEKGIIL